MENILNRIKVIAEKRFVKDQSTSLNVYTNTSNSSLIVEIVNTLIIKLSINEILEFYRDIYLECNVGSFNDILIRNCAESSIIFEIPLVNEGISN